MGTRSLSGVRLRTEGFDLSHYDRSALRWRVKCSQCEATCVNGTPCHEKGCPNQPKEPAVAD